ncbi:MAG TPA: GAF domain-containing protein [Dehalococcoidia bacterium]|nr:GAF domain-containing protein [Dehalococcoidia bacterium]
MNLMDVVDSVEDELLVIGRDYRIQFANLAVRARFQKKAESLIGKVCYQALHDQDKPCSMPLWDCPINKIVQSGSTVTFIHSDQTTGATRYLKITAYPLRDQNGNIAAVVELRRDVTAERELESQILRRHYQLSTLSRISSVVTERQDLDTILRNALDSVLELINADIGGILLWDEETKTLRYRVYRGLSPSHAQEIQLSPGEGVAGRVAQTGEPILLDDISQDPRNARPVSIRAEGIRGFVSIPLKSKAKVVGVMNVASHAVGKFGADDVSLLSSIGDYLGTAVEQASLYTRLEGARERYQALLRYALTAQEDERKRIARELHDDTSQAITSLTLSLQAITAMAEMKGITDAEFMNKVKTTQSFAVHTGYEIVRLMKELRPTLLDELGLAAAIHRYAKDSLEAQGINVSAEFSEMEERLPPEIEVTLYRVAQGLIGNILEHSGAKNVSIKLERDDNECILRIEDDGKGFDVSKLTRVEASGRGAGLFTMRERMSLVGGIGIVESKLGRGTRAIAKVPLVKDVTDEENKGVNS